MSENRATIRTRVRRFVGTAIDLTINEAIREKHKSLQRKRNWSFMQATNPTTFSAGDTSFTLPTDFKAIVNPEVFDGDIYYRLSGLIKNGVDGRSTTDTGMTVFFRLWNGYGYIYPKPHQTITFNLEYYKWLDELTADDALEEGSDDEAFLNFVHKAIEYHAIGAGFEKLQNYKAAAYWNAKAKSLTEELENDDLDNELQGIDLVMEMPG